MLGALKATSRTKLALGSCKLGLRRSLKRPAPRCLQRRRAAGAMADGDGTEPRSLDDRWVLLEP